MLLQLPRGQSNFAEKWTLMNPNDMIFIIAIYFIFVLKIGPWLMEKRSPYQLKTFLVFYNAAKVINSAFLMHAFFSYIREKGLFPKTCNYDEHTVFVIADLYWKYMITKVLDLCDTVIFVIRKKYNQITFLHVYHHVFMVLVTWFALKFDPSDHWAFMALANCVIHGIMYTYYGISALGPEYAKYLWWKKYLTILQLVQFILIFIHVVIQTYTTLCPMGTMTYWIGISNLMLFLFLFLDFYNKRYKNKMKDTTLACTRRASD